MIYDLYIDARSAAPRPASRNQYDDTAMLTARVGGPRDPEKHTSKHTQSCSTSSSPPQLAADAVRPASSRRLLLVAGPVGLVQVAHDGRRLEHQPELGLVLESAAIVRYLYQTYGTGDKKKAA